IRASASRSLRCGERGQHESGDRLVMPCIVIFPPRCVFSQLAVNCMGVVSVCRCVSVGTLTEKAKHSNVLMLLVSVFRLILHWQISKRHRGSICQYVGIRGSNKRIGNFTRTLTQALKNPCGIGTFLFRWHRNTPSHTHTPTCAATENRRA